MLNDATEMPARMSMNQQPNRLCVVSTWGEGSRDSNASHPVLGLERHGPSNFKLKGNKFNLKLNGKQKLL